MVSEGRGTSELGSARGDLLPERPRATVLIELIQITEWGPAGPANNSTSSGNKSLMPEFLQSVSAATLHLRPLRI